MPTDVSSENNEQDFLKVIKNEMTYVNTAPTLATTREALDKSILESGALLRSIGRGGDLDRIEIVKEEHTPSPLVIRSFDDLLKDATANYPNDIDFEDLFTEAELAANHEYILSLSAEFDAVHKLDALEVIIPAVAGILGGAVDCFFGGFVRNDSGKSIPGSLSAYVEKIFNKALPAEKILELEKLAHVTYDATNNLNTEVLIDTLSPHFHRLLQLGHDPILGFIFGVVDMLRGTMTTIDYKGKFVVQIMECYSDRKAATLFEAIAKVFLHMLSDVNTPAGLPVPFMALFSKFQFGHIGVEGLNIAELVKGMYGQGYDFRHFCAMSIPVMITEVIVRVSYFAKRLSEGHSFMEAIPFGLDHQKKPKLATMLFIAHSASTAINAGKIVFTKNPMDINYPQWISFARYSVKQLKWALLEKPALREKYVADAIDGHWNELSASIDVLWDELASETT